MLELRRLAADDWEFWRAVRLAALADAPHAFGATLAEWTGSGDTELRWRHRLDTVPLNLVAIVDECPAGQASGTERDPDGRVEVISMWVAPWCRRRGVGLALLDGVVDWARDEAASAVALAVKRSNQPAAALYLRAGFERTDEPAHAPDEELMIQALGASEVARPLSTGD